MPDLFATTFDFATVAGRKILVLVLGIGGGFVFALAPGDEPA